MSSPFWLYRPSRFAAVFLSFAILLPRLEAAEAGAAAADRFDVFELRVLGNTLLPGREIETLLYPYLGTDKTLADVEVARKALEDLFHERGYGTVFVDIPEQMVDGGLVRLKVTEAKLARVQVTGARYFSGREIRNSLPEAMPGRTPLLTVLQAQLAAINARTRDRSVVPVLRAGAAPGTVDLALRVEDHLPLHATFELNNQNTAQTEPLRASFGLSYDNLFGRFGSLSLQYQTAPEEPDQTSVWLLNFGTNVFDERTRLALYYFKSDSDIATLGTAEATVSVLGQGSVFGARLIRPLSTSSGSLHTLTLGLDYKDFLQNIAVQSLAGSAEDKSELLTPISYLNLSLAYSGGWTLGPGRLTWGASGNFGVRHWQNDAAEFETKRFRANPNYFYLRSDGEYRLGLPAGMEARLGFSGQLAADPIISNEQFSIAGANGVRGYLEAEELGDRGIRTFFELGSPVWRPLDDMLSVGGFAFYDYGAFSLAQPLPSDRANASLHSWGLGLDIAAFRMFTGTITWAYPLKDGSDTLRGDDQLLFLIRGQL